MQSNRRSRSLFRFARLQSCRAGIAFLMLAGTAGAFADNYPSRPVRIVVPTQAGAAQDIIARLLQPYLEKAFGQPIIVENRSGASTMIGTDAVAKAAPDGYTLLIVPTTFTVNAALNSKLILRPRTRFRADHRAAQESASVRGQFQGASAHARRIRGAGQS